MTDQLASLLQLTERTRGREGDHPGCTILSCTLRRGSLGTPGRATKLHPCGALGATAPSLHAKGVVTRMGRDPNGAG